MASFLKKAKKYKNTLEAKMSRDKAVHQVVEEKNRSWTSDAMVKHYAKAVDVNRQGDSFLSTVYPLFRHYAPQGARILDVGCGSGRLTFAFHADGYKVTAFDISEGMIQHIREQDVSGTIETRLGDGKRIAAEDGEFDVVVSMDFLLHFPNWQDYLQEKLRACKSGGLVMYNFESRENKQHADQFADTGTGYRYIYTDDVQDRSQPFCATDTRAELEAACEALGAEIVAEHPYDFFVRNALFGNIVGSEGEQQFLDAYRQHAEQKPVADFIAFVEKSLVQHFPRWMARRRVIVLRKR